MAAYTVTLYNCSRRKGVANMVSEAQKRAKAKYDAANVRRVVVKFYPSESDMLEWMDENGYKSAWIKGLIRREFEKENGK